MKSTDYQPLNDGLLEYGDIVTVRDDRTSKKTGERFESVGSLFFGYKQINSRFDSYTVGSLSVVDVKVMCYCVPDFDKSHKIRIGSVLYAIEGLDVASDRVYMYLFLRKVGYWNGSCFEQVS